MGNFSRYVRPSAIRHDVTGVGRPLRVLAFEEAPNTASVPVQRPAGGSWSVVVINNAAAGSGPISLRLQLPRTPGSVRLVPEVAVETSADRDLESVDLPTATARGVLSAMVNAQSITTYVLRATT
jgi:hypothetical protein